MESYWHKGYFEIWVLACQTSGLAGKIEERVIFALRDQESDAKRKIVNVRDGNDGNVKHNQCTYIAPSVEVLGFSVAHQHASTVDMMWGYCG